MVGTETNVGKGAGSRGREQNTFGIPVPVPTRSQPDHIFPTRPLPRVPLQKFVFFVHESGLPEGTHLGDEKLGKFR